MNLYKMYRSTIYIPKQLYKDAKVYCAQHGTTVPRLIAEHLCSITGMKFNMRIKCRKNYLLIGVKEYQAPKQYDDRMESSDGKTHTVDELKGML